MKNFIDFLRHESSDFRRPLVIAIIAAGIINGLGVMVAVNAVRNVKAGQTDARAFLLFCACIVGYWISKQLVLDRTTTIVEDIIERLRLRILHKLKETDLLPFEGIDKGRVYAALSSDAVNISNSAVMVLNASSSLVMLAFISVLLAFISMKALIMTMILIGIVILYYSRHARRVEEQLSASTQRENEFFGNLHGFLDGFKELKLNREKRADYFTRELQDIIHMTNLHRVDAGRAMNHALLIAHTYNFFALAGIIFAMPVLFPNEASIVPALVPVILFAAGPLGDVVTAVPALARAEASIVNIRELEESVDNSVADSRIVAPAVVSPQPPFESLLCQDLKFQYPGSARHPFRIRGANLELKAGEIVFLVGGNGSGKSTLLKLLTGLYRPESGRILLNGSEVDDGNITNLREMFSPIFTDFHLFPRLLGGQQFDRARIEELLTRMELQDRTSIVDGRITNMNLSTGQRKRLSLVISTLDDRPVHLFDEWAADQDPVFRKFFYEVLLRQMTAQGKTILAATHDDHYFHVADKVYRMEYGELLPYETSRGKQS